jgi:hypothetical protein
MNTLTVKLKNGESFKFENFKDFSIDINIRSLEVICEKGLYNYFSMDCVYYIIQSESIPEEKFTLIIDGNGGLLKIKETESVCPVCNGKGFVQGNFYDIPGNNVSFGSYIENGMKTEICRNCNGKGTIIKGGQQPPTDKGGGKQP